MNSFDPIDNHYVSKPDVSDEELNSMISYLTLQSRFYLPEGYLKLILADFEMIIYPEKSQLKYTTNSKIITFNEQTLDIEMTLDIDTSDIKMVMLDNDKMTKEELKKFPDICSKITKFNIKSYLKRYDQLKKSLNSESNQRLPHIETPQAKVSEVGRLPGPRGRT